MAVDNKKRTDNKRVDDEDCVDTGPPFPNFDHISPQMVQLDVETDATSWNGSTCARESYSATPMKIDLGSESGVYTTGSSRYPSSEHFNRKKATKEKSYEFTCRAKCRRRRIHNTCFALFCVMAAAALAISLYLLERPKSPDDTSELLKRIQQLENSDRENSLRQELQKLTERQHATDIRLEDAINKSEVIKTYMEHTKTSLIGQLLDLTNDFSQSTNELNIFKREQNDARENINKEIANVTKTMKDDKKKMAAELKSMKSLLEQIEENVNQRIENNEQEITKAKEEMSQGIDRIKADVKDTNDKMTEEVKNLTKKINDSAKEVLDLKTSLQNTENKLSQEIQEVKSQVEERNAGNTPEQRFDNLAKKVDALESKQESSDEERKQISQGVNGLRNEINNLRNKPQSPENGSTRPGSWGIHLVLILLACFYLY